MSKANTPHVIVSWAKDFVNEDVNVVDLQDISRVVEKLYLKRTGKPLQVTTIVRDIKDPYREK